MRLAEALGQVRVLEIPGRHEAEATAAGRLRERLLPGARIRRLAPGRPPRGVLRVAVREGSGPGEAWTYLRLSPRGEGLLAASHPALLFAAACRLEEDLPDEPLSRFLRGRYFRAGFPWRRPLYDCLLTQCWRDARFFDPEEHIRHLARLGFTHAEVNALAFPVPYVERVPGEFYAPFYTYAPALDQFVESRLTAGTYPAEYLGANLSVLKRYAGLALKHGLSPGLLCFEPRSLPDRFFDRYPTLRGPRVDHPFRSWKPRYAMAISHPAVQAHYAELMGRLMREVPALSYLSVWTNDSGAGVEHTTSLYAGRNGGAFLVREWRDHAQIAQAAGRNLVGFLKVLRDAASEVNPDFRVSLRLEPFKTEHDAIVAGLADRLDMEVPSMLVRGYDLPYAHGQYPDVKGVAGSVHHLGLVPREAALLSRFRRRGVAGHLIYSHGTGFNFEPLVCVPCPWMACEKVLAMRERGVTHAAHLGGAVPPSLAPFHVNQEVERALQLDDAETPDGAVSRLARRWAGRRAGRLVRLWRLSDGAVRRLPPLPLYSWFGFTWLRTWVRPLVPDIEAIPGAERAYYERYVAGTANNPNLVDLGRDVLFELVTPAYAARFAARVDRHVLPRLDRAIRESEGLPGAAFEDLHVRMRSLRCWVETLRNVAAWVAGVHGWLGSSSPRRRAACRALLDGMVRREIANAEALRALWRESRVPWMFVARQTESTYLYGENFPDLLARKVRLMRRYGGLRPRIDAGFMWRLPS